jgi:hypothetical protein
MKIRQLLSGMDIVLTNQEQSFVEKHSDKISMTGLDEHNQWLAQNLVRKGVYTISKDTHTLIRKIHETNSH